MSKILNRYLVHFKGLKTGKHIINFDVDNAFFEEFEGSEISKGSLSVYIELERMVNMMEFDIDIDGEVEVLCDHCLEPFVIPTSFEGKLIVRISDTIQENENIDDVWYINNNEYELNLAHYIYESICLSLPIQRFHGILGTSEKDCDKGMLDRLTQLSDPQSNGSNRGDGDERWDKLKDLMNN